MLVEPVGYSARYPLRGHRHTASAVRHPSNAIHSLPFFRGKLFRWELLKIDMREFMLEITPIQLYVRVSVKDPRAQLHPTPRALAGAVQRGRVSED